jgi:uncharacterized protein YbjT (DUF2867 family)
MKVAIAGGHGQIGLRLTRLLAERGDQVRSLIRNSDHADEVREAGAEPVICDLEAASEQELASAVDSVDAVVFAAGAGPGSGPERKESMDYGGAVKLIAAAKLNGISRYAMVSSIGADPNATGDGFGVYLRAKGRADAELAASGLDYTIVRPVSLTDDSGSGRVQLGDGVEGKEITREDVATVLAAILESPAAVGKTLEASAGELPIEEAIAAL